MCCVRARREAVPDALVQSSSGADKGNSDDGEELHCDGYMIVWVES
jgi:hypothetical protein